MLLVTTWFGAFLWDNGTILHSRLFPKNAKDIASRLAEMERGVVLGEELELLKICDQSADVTDRRLGKFGRVSDKKVDVDPGKYGFSHGLLHDALVYLGTQKSMEKPDESFHIMQALRLADSMTETNNLLSERVRDWYSVHFPELRMLVAEDDYIKLVAKTKNRDELASEIRFEGPSIGSEVEPGDYGQVRGAAQTIVTLKDAKSVLERYIDGKMREAAPNLCHLTGPLLGARLVSLAGGLGKLASKPSSTIQLLGAENALFRHLKSGVKPPKYGVIFQHPYIHGAPRHLRGKIARSFAGAIAIAVKVDYNKGGFVADSLKEKIEKRIGSMKDSKKPAADRDKGREWDGRDAAPKKSRQG